MFGQLSEHVTYAVCKKQLFMNIIIEKWKNMLSMRKNQRMSEE